MPASTPLLAGFLNAAERFPNRPALSVAGLCLTYSELLTRVASLGISLPYHVQSGGSPLTAVFASRTSTAYAGVLASLYRGHGYVPLNPNFPADRNAAMLARSNTASLIVDSVCETQLPLVLSSVPQSLTVLLPDTRECGELRERLPQHRFVSAPEIDSVDARRPPSPHAEYAYLLFTSGSTGSPKGVLVSQSNVRHYVDFVLRQYSLCEHDRCSQTFDLTFDLSAHDMFVTWQAGACLCCPTQKELLKPGAFIQSSAITSWFSVPSTAVFMKRFGVLKPGLYPGLRLSLFCGEPLPAEVARTWSEAAPKSRVENLYGPTELTIACMRYPWDPGRSPADCELGIVPIGEPFENMEAFVATEKFAEVSPGEEGELLMTGPQLSLGYWQDEEKTSIAFVRPPGKEQIFYRTGDRVRRPMPGRPMVYIGRMDNQIKVLGHRVELGEIEAAVRDASGIDAVVALGWPLTPSGAAGIEVFLQTTVIDEPSLRHRLAIRLPAYMLPRRLLCLPEFPLNSNGKFDRRALAALLANAGDGDAGPSGSTKGT